MIIHKSPQSNTIKNNYPQYANQNRNFLNSLKNNSIQINQQWTI